MSSLAASAVTAGRAPTPSFKTAAQPRNLAKPPEVAEYLGVPEKTLAEWRSQGKGPEWRKVGRYARYRWTDIEHWVEQQRRGGEAA